MGREQVLASSVGRISQGFGRGFTNLRVRPLLERTVKSKFNWRKGRPKESRDSQKDKRKRTRQIGRTH